MGATEDRLFERWCRHGDAEALGELFDLASPGLLRLAIHLVGEPAEAEDLVQATFLAAIEQRASVDSSRPVLPWLTAVLSNKAADHKRRAGRELDVEHLLASVEEDAAHPAEVRELSGELAKAIDALEEPYRQVMILRLRHGLSPADIAHVLERSPGAVRVQLHRAQQKLRGRLPSSLVGAFLIGAAAPRGLAAVRTDILEEALSVAPAASVAATTATVLGGLVMGKKIAVAVVAGLLAAGAWWLSAHDAMPQASSPRSDDGSADPVAGVENSANPDPPHSDQQRVAVRTDLEPTATSRFGSLDIDLVWSDGTPAAGVGLEQIGTVSTHGRSSLWMSDASGRIHIDRIPAGPRGFVLDRWSRNDGSPQQPKVDVQAGVLNHLLVQVPRGRDVKGRVLAADGKAVAGAELWGVSWASPHLLGHSTQDGTFFLRSLSSGEYSLFATADQRGISRSLQLAELEQDAQGTLLADIQLSPTTAGLAGKVVGTNGEPIADADVNVTLQADTSVGRKFLRQRTQADGTFRMAGLCRSSVTIEVGAPDHPLWTAYLRLEDKQEEWIDIHLQEGVTVVGTLRLPDGSPARGRVEWAGNSRLQQPGDLGWKRIQTGADESGVFTLTGLPPGEIRLTATGGDSNERRGRAFTTLQGSPGETLRWDASLTVNDGQIRGRVVDERGQPQSAWFVYAFPKGAVDSSQSSARTDSEGRFLLEGCADVDHIVQLQWPGKKTMTKVAEMDFVRPGGDELLFRVPAGAVPLASIKGIVLDSANEPIPNLMVSAENDLGDLLGRSNYEADGSFSIELLSAGRYHLACSSNQLGGEMLGAFELHAEEALDVGTLHLSPRGFLEASMRRSDGATLSGPQTRLVGEAGRYGTLSDESTEDGVLFRSKPLVPGRYLIYPIFSNAGGPMREVQIRAGETTSIELELEPAARRYLHFRVPARAQPPPRLNLVIFDASGAQYLEAESRYVIRDRDGYWSHSLLYSFPPGSYHFDATSKEGLTASGSLDVPSAEEPYEPITIDLAPAK